MYTGSGWWAVGGETAGKGGKWGVFGGSLGSRGNGQHHKERLYEDDVMGGFGTEKRELSNVHMVMWEEMENSMKRGA